MAFLFTNQTSDADSDGHAPGGAATIHTTGTLDGAYLQVQIAPSNTANLYEPPTGTNLNMIRAPGNVNVDAQGGYFVRVLLRGSTATTNVTVEVTP